VTKHFWNKNIMGHPLGEVLKTVTSKHYQPYFTNIMGNTLWSCLLVTYQYILTIKVGTTANIVSEP